ncbi:MAG: hypothetical protein ACREP9_16410, partial [Candidatus Dormibacteraceae bacterium]
MKTLRILIFAIMTTVMVFPVAPQTASAAAASPSPVASVQDAQAKLADLNNQVEQGQGKLDELDRQLTSARKQEEAVNGQVSELARLQYEQPMMSISMVMGALTLDQLLGDIAQSRLVAHKQSDLLGEARSLADQDQKTRDQQSKQLDGIKSARD